MATTVHIDIIILYTGPNKGWLLLHVSSNPEKGYCLIVSYSLFLSVQTLSPGFQYSWVTTMCSPANVIFPNLTPLTSTLNMEAWNVRHSTQIRQCHNPEDYNLITHCHENMAVTIILDEPKLIGFKGTLILYSVRWAFVSLFSFTCLSIQKKWVKYKIFNFGARVLILKRRYPPFSKRVTNKSCRSKQSWHMWLKFKDITAVVSVK